MPVTPTHPGVYLEEIPSGVRTIVGVSTSITAFVGRARRGPVDDPRTIHDFADFERIHGGLWEQSTMSYAVRHYFQNGGQDAVIIRVARSNDPVPADNSSVASADLPAGAATFTIAAANDGAWGNALCVRVDHDTRPPLSGETSDALFNLTVKDMTTGDLERFLNVSIQPKHSGLVEAVLQRESMLVRVQGTLPVIRPDAHATVAVGADPFATAGACTQLTGGSDGADVEGADFSGPGMEDGQRGIYALEKADIFNLLCIPPLAFFTDVDVASTLSDALTYCKKRRAMLIVDPPSGWTTNDLAMAGITAFPLAKDRNAAIFFPRLRAPDPLREGRLNTFVPCGAVAGVFARTDAKRGIWKAPAGMKAKLNGVVGLSVLLTGRANGDLNALGVNCLRSLPIIGGVIWGSRTLEGTDQLDSEWKYIPVRRLALFIEESLYRGTKWAVFEPNDEPLWAQLRLNIGVFMQKLFRQGAFAGRTPREAYFVRCDKETTSQDDINRGIVNILIGFVTLKPKEFVIIKIQQMAARRES